MDTHIRHELLARNADFLGECGAEHHDLLVMRGYTENFLDVTTHVYIGFPKYEIIVEIITVRQKRRTKFRAEQVPSAYSSSDC